MRVRPPTIVVSISTADSWDRRPRAPERYCFRWLPATSSCDMLAPCTMEGTD